MAYRSRGRRRSFRGRSRRVFSGRRGRAGRRSTRALRIGYRM